MEICKWETFGNDQFENEQQSNSADGGIAQSESHGVPEAKGNQNKTAETLTKIGRFVGSERALKEKVLGQMREVINEQWRKEEMIGIFAYFRLPRQVQILQRCENYRIG
jgi:hypothetical protein